MCSVQEQCDKCYHGVRDRWMEKNNADVLAHHHSRGLFS